MQKISIQSFKVFSGLLLIMILIGIAVDIAAQVPRNVLNQAKSRVRSVNSATKNASDTSGKDGAGFERRDDLADSITISFRYCIPFFISCFIPVFAMHGYV